MTRHAHAVGVLEIGVDVVVDVAIELLARAPDRAARSHHADRMGVAHHPVDDVDVVQVLLDDLVAANPHVRVPGALLPCERILVEPLLKVGALDDRAGNPVGVGGHHIADLSVLDALHRLDVLPLGTALGADHDRELFLLGLLRQADHLLRSHHVGGQRLFGEHVLVGVDGVLEVQRAPARRGVQEHHVHAGIDDLLVGVVAQVAVFWRDLDLLLDFGREFVRVAQSAQGALELVFKQVSHHVEFVVGVAANGFCDATGAASATAHDPDRQLFVFIAPQSLGPHDLQAGRCRSRRSGGSLHEVAAREVLGCVRRRRSRFWHWLLSFWIQGCAAGR